MTTPQHSSPMTVSGANGESFASTIFDTLTTGVIVLRSDLTLLELNSAAETLLRVSRSHAIDQPLNHLVLQPSDLTPRLHSAIASKQSFSLREAPILLPDKMRFTADLTVTPAEDEAQNSVLVLELHPTDRLRSIDRDGELLRRQETAQMLVRGIAHEVKNPLGGIRGAAQLLERELNNPTLTEYTQVIVDEVDRLRALVDRMLGPVRQPQFSDVNMFRICEHVINLCEAREPDLITWVRDYDPSLPDLWGDEDQLIQAVLNVFVNATQAIGQVTSPEIIVRTRVARQFTIGTNMHRLAFRLDVIDNGPGIDPAIEPRIFMPMITSRADGTGLGLAIAQSILAQHNGIIQLDTVAGRTCFSFFLPLEHTAEREAALRQSRDKP